MPFKKNFRRKRNFRKRRPRRKYVATIKKSPMPVKFTTKLRYAHNFNLDAGIAGIATQVFSCNGIYDPDITGAGHQPRGFDELMPLYNHYRVLGAYMTLRVNNGSSDQGSIYGISIQDTSSALSLLNDYLESGTVRSKLVGTNDGMGISGMKFKICPHKWMGLKYDEDNLRGSVSANPTEQAYFHIFTGCVDDTVNPAALQCYVVIDYLVQFIEPNALTQS